MYTPVQHSSVRRNMALPDPYWISAEYDRLLNLDPYSEYGSGSRLRVPGFCGQIPLARLIC